MRSGSSSRYDRWIASVKAWTWPSPWILFVVLAVAFFIVLLRGIYLGMGLTEWVLWLTGVVVVLYTVETQGLRLEMVRQNEMAIRPILLASIERRQIKGDPQSCLILRNIGRGPALFIDVKDIESSTGPEGRFVAKFETVDCIEVGKDAVINSAIHIEIPGEDEKIKTWIDFASHLHPQYGNQSYDVTITYEDVNGQKRESVVKMGKGGIRLLKPGTITS